MDHKSPANELDPQLVAIQIADAVSHEIPQLGENVAAHDGSKGDRPASIVASLIRKSSEDLATSCLLVRRGFPGTPKIINRTIREHAVVCLYIALGDADERSAYAQQFDATRPAQAAQLLHNKATTTLNTMGDVLDSHSKQRLAALHLPDNKLKQAREAIQQKREVPGLQKMLEIVARRLIDRQWAPAGLVANQFIEIWRESEAVHVTQGALNHYAINSHTLQRDMEEREYELLYTAMDLRDLYVLLLLASAAETGTVGRIEPTPVTKYLDDIFQIGKALLNTHYSNK